MDASMSDSDDLDQSKVTAFLDDIEAVCRKHGLCISHEDAHGAFEIETFDQYFINWLRSYYGKRR